jgi:hypothetical protein
MDYRLSDIERSVLSLERMDDRFTSLETRLMDLNIRIGELEKEFRTKVVKLEDDLGNRENERMFSFYLLMVVLSFTVGILNSTSSIFLLDNNLLM